MLVSTQVAKKFWTVSVDGQAIEDTSGTVMEFQDKQLALEVGRAKLKGNPRAQITLQEWTIAEEQVLN
jgi:hypothetical protein